jgi:hypothetical protein
VPKHKYECSRCGKKLMTSLDSMLHASEHVKGYVPRSEAHRRPVSCWRCAKEMPVPADGSSDYTCECGFVLPPKAQFQELPSAEN